MISPGRPILGVDVGGTTFEVILLDGAGRVTAAAEDATPRSVPAAEAVKTVATAARAVAVAARARGLATRGEGPALLACVNGRVEDITAREVFAAAAAGDPACARVVAAAVAALGAALTVLVNVLNPEVIAVGGGVAGAGAALLDPVRAAVRASAWTPAAEAVRIVPAALGTQAGAIGAALFVAEALRGC